MGDITATTGNETESVVDCNQAALGFETAVYRTGSGNTTVTIANEGREYLEAVEINLFSGGAVVAQKGVSNLSSGGIGTVVFESDGDEVTAVSKGCPSVMADTAVGTESTSVLFQVSGDGWGDGSFKQTTAESPLKLIINDRVPLKEWEYTGHGDDVEDVLVGDNGAVYSASSDNTVRKIDSGGNLVWEYTGHNDNVYTLTIDSEGNVYSGGAGNEVHKINVSAAPTGGSKFDKSSWRYTNHTARVRGLAVSDGGLYSAALDEMHKINMTTGKQAWKYTDYEGNLWGLSSDDSGNTHSIAGEIVHQVNSTGETEWNYSGHTDVLRAVATDSEGNAYSGGHDNEVHKIEADTGNRLWNYTGHPENVYSLSVDGDGGVYSGGLDGDVHKINVIAAPTDGSNFDDNVWQYTGHDDWVKAIDADGEGGFYSGSEDNEVHKVFEREEHARSGNYTSETFDAGTNVNWSSITVEAALNGENITGEVEADTENMTGEFGTDGETTEDFRLQHGENEEFSLDLSENYRYIRFQIRLETSNVTVTPEVESVEVAGIAEKR